jgi:pilus assembly protein Flp/PilA
MQSLWQAFWSDESGQGLVEYALIIALVAVGLIAILLVLRNSIGNVFNNAATVLNNAPTNPYPCRSSSRQRWARVPPHLAGKLPGLPTAGGGHIPGLVGNLRSDALAKEAERLRVEIQKKQASRDRRKKPRVKGK